MTESNLEGEMPTIANNMKGIGLEDEQRNTHYGMCSEKETEHGTNTSSYAIMSTAPSNENPFEQQMESPSPAVPNFFAGTYNSLNDNPGSELDNFASVENTESYQVLCTYKT